MNEFIFFLYLLFIIFSSLCALKLGKEALFALVSSEVVLMNLLVSEEILLFGFHATPVDALAVGTALGLNLINEYYGKQAALKAVTISSLAGLFYMFVSLLHCAYQPAPTDLYAAHFLPVLSLAPRIIIASFIAYYITQQFEAYLYFFLKKSWLSPYFLVRNYCSLLITQALDTVLFTLVGLAGILDNLVSVMLVAYTIKIITVMCAVPFITYARRFITPAQKL
jgi:uncharacterized integral membrane protein (TIGR00697 family)